jgi:hypothetical protein
MVMLGHKIHKTLISQRHVLILIAHLPLGITRVHFSLWFSLMFCDHLSYYKGIHTNIALNIGKYILRSCDCTSRQILIIKPTRVSFQNKFEKLVHLVRFIIRIGKYCLL